MSVEDGMAVVACWFTDFWGSDFDAGVIDDLAAPDIRFEYWADLIAEGDYGVGRLKGGGTHPGPAFDDLPGWAPCRPIRA
jgi:hypothetical protein